MRNDFEKLVWLYSMGVEDIATRQSINYFDVQIKDQINDSSTQDLHTSQKTEEIRVPEGGNQSYETFKKDINGIDDIMVLEKYWSSTLINTFNIKKFWGLNDIDVSKKLNILIIHEPPSVSDFNRYSLLDGKKRNLINNIILAILSDKSETEAQNIFSPILPIPLNNTTHFENIQSFHLMFLSSLKRIIEPSLVLLVGDRATSYISPKLEADDKGIEKENHYFSIPELEYMMSVPEVKKTVWEEWKQKRKTIKNDLFL
ncbi:hypothetical protein OA385_02655 [Paracoccaceae bacterium]|nr:hypothetical protein [Paracoccaceae bacterium]